MNESGRSNLPPVLRARILTLYALVGTGVLWLLALVLMRPVIASLYKGTFPLEAANRLLAGRGEHSLEHYLQYANSVLGCLLIGFLIFSLLSIYTGFYLLPAISGDAKSMTRLPVCAWVPLCLVAWAVRFIQDDAFISFTYADRLVRGLGLTWTDGERIEGYTNFLWTMLMSLGGRLGADLIVWSQVLGLLCFLGSLVFIVRLSGNFGDRRVVAPIALALAASNFTFLAYATGGLETSLQCVLCLAVLYLSLTIVKTNAYVGVPLALLSLCAAAALMTRLDSALLLLGPCLYLLISLLRSERSIGEKVRGVLAVGLPGAVCLVTWFAWKHAYYGELLPNTFYAKVGTGPPLEQGLWYGWTFLRAYWVVPFALLLVALLVRRGGRREMSVPAILLLLMIVIWFAYVIKVGGDFMEFRFFVPLVPVIAIAMAYFVTQCIDRPIFRAAVVVAAILSSVVHAQTFKGMTRGVEAVSSLHHWITFPYSSFPDIGRTLHDLFGGAEDFTIAVTAAGAIPYYSRLASIDMIGLNDRWIARHGRVISKRPGHHRITTLDYLQKRSVNLVIGHPHTRPSSERRGATTPDSVAVQYFADMFPREQLPAGADIVEVPFNQSAVISMLYLARHEAVDAAVTSGRLRRFRFPEDLR